MTEHKIEELHQKLDEIRQDVDKMQAALQHIFHAIDELSKLTFDVPQLVAKSQTGGEGRPELLTLVKDEAASLQSALKQVHPLIWGKSR